MASSFEQSEVRAQSPVTARTKDRLVEVAAELFRRRGYANTTTREIAQVLGIQKATLYHHIENKEDLLEAVCLESLRRLMVEVNEILKTEPRPLRSLIFMHLTIALNDRDLHATMLLESGALQSERRARVAQKRSEYERLLRGVIAADQRAGHLRSDIDARLLTLALLNLLNWTVFWFHPDGEWSPEQLADSFTELYLHGATAHDT